MSVAAIIVAGGQGVRAGGDIPKQYIPLGGTPVLTWSIRAFADAGIGRIIVVAANEHADFCRAATDAGPQVQIVTGGATRTASVRAGLKAAGDAGIILIHDAARPGLPPQILRDLIARIEAGDDAVAPALPIADSLVRTDANGAATELDRTNTMRVQTPQAFRGAILRAAYAAASDDAVFSDDLSVVRAAGATTRIIPGDARLMKLTYPEDLPMLQRMLGGERIVCVGNGVDAHRFGPGEFVTLCGVRIPHTSGLLGHSDADAGWHALVDAILGALGEGDIGAHFPPSDPQWKGADSESFLRRAVQLADAARARILHVDVTLICERPKIGPHRDQMRARTAEVLGLPIERVSIKATTTERMGFVGREEGLAAQATATLDRPL